MDDLLAELWKIVGNPAGSVETKRVTSLPSLCRAFEQADKKKLLKSTEADFLNNKYDI